MSDSVDEIEEDQVTEKQTEQEALIGVISDTIDTLGDSLHGVANADASMTREALIQLQTNVLVTKNGLLRLTRVCNWVWAELEKRINTPEDLQL